MNTLVTGTVDPLSGFFRIVTIARTVLSAGSYVIDAFLPGNTDTWTCSPFDTPTGIKGLSVNPSITIGPAGSARFNYGSGETASALPTSTDSSIGHSRALFVGANFQIAGGVPEPSTWAMMILGLAGLGFINYRRRKGTMHTA